MWTVQPRHSSNQRAFCPREVSGHLPMNMLKLRRNIGGLLILSGALTCCTSTTQSTVPLASTLSGARVAQAVESSAAATLSTGHVQPASSAPSVTAVVPSGPTSGASSGGPSTSAASTGAPASTSATPDDNSTMTNNSVPTTPVPVVGGGNIDQTVSEVPVTTRAQVSLTAMAAYGTGVAAALVKISSLKTTPQLPGEIAGPGVAITVRITNSSTKTIDLSSVLVDVQDAAGTPSIPMTGAPAEPLRGPLAPGAAASGVYVFTLSTDFKGDAHIAVGYSSKAPVALFVGNVK